MVPYFGYARADRKAHGRESIAAKLTANLLTEAGIDRMLSIDLHSGQCVGYFDIPVDHVYGESVLLDYLSSKGIPNGTFRDPAYFFCGVKRSSCCVAVLFPCEPTASHTQCIAATKHH